MSDKAYIDIYKYMTDDQRDAMTDLWMTGKNITIPGQEGHVWVNYADVERTVARLLKGQKHE